jgi:hypothetical protein
MEVLNEETVMNMEVLVLQILKEMKQAEVLL